MFPGGTGNAPEKKVKKVTDWKLSHISLKLNGIIIYCFLVLWHDGEAIRGLVNIRVLKCKTAKFPIWQSCSKLTMVIVWNVKWAAQEILEFMRIYTSMAVRGKSLNSKSNLCSHQPVNWARLFRLSLVSVPHFIMETVNEISSKPAVRFTMTPLQ